MPCETRGKELAPNRVSTRQDQKVLRSHPPLHPRNGKSAPGKPQGRDIVNHSAHYPHGDE
jgi:hypothetical protein